MTAVACIHRWLIAPANGPTSAGVCRDCGASKDFPNSLSVDYFDFRMQPKAVKEARARGAFIHAEATRRTG